MAGLNCSESNEEYSNMSDSAVISCSMQSDDRGILHGERQQPGENTLRACSAVIALFKRFRAIINRGPDIGIASKICDAPVAFKKFWMKPGAERMLFGKFFRIGNRADEFQSDFPAVFEFAPVKHVKTGNTDKSASSRRFDIRVYLPARVAGYSGEGI